MAKYEKVVDRKRATFVFEPEDLTDEEKLQLLDLLIQEIEIVGEDKLKANVHDKKLRQKAKVVLSTERERIVDDLYED